VKVDKKLVMSGCPRFWPEALSDSPSDVKSSSESVDPRSDSLSPSTSTCTSIPPAAALGGASGLDILEIERWV
jgi:hypothetical protein